MTGHTSSRGYPVILFVIFVISWTILAIRPVYRFDWLLENLLVVISLPFLIISYKKSLFSNLSWTFAFILMLLHIIGAHYTYSAVPAGDAFSRWAGLDRNHYDRMVHFLFGFCLILPLKELIVKKINCTDLWLNLIAFCIIATVGVLYELLEWGAAMIFDPQAGTAFLGVQGDEWDAQKDLAFKMAGALFFILILSAIKKKQ